MGIDVRYPLTVLFATIGSILIVCGMLLPTGINHKSFNINLNLYWGILLLLFSAIMYGWIFVDKHKNRPYK